MNKIKFSFRIMIKRLAEAFSSIALQILIVSILFFSWGCNKPMAETDNIEKTTSNFAAIDAEQELAMANTVAGNKRVLFPEEDPGAPLYLRATSLLNQFFVSDGWLVIPFYRNPDCVRSDFNILQLFDVPQAFSCPLTVQGHYIIEKNAPLGTLPIIVQSTSSAMPFWFVRWDEFSLAAADGVVTMPELRGMNPLKGVAAKFTETLRPRMDNHLVQINASGALMDGRLFTFHVTHLGDQTKSLQLSFR
jgi:hypothetical protein